MRAVSGAPARPGRALWPLGVLLFIVVAVASALGRQNTSFATLLSACSSQPSAEATKLLHVLREIRLPRIAAAALVGAGLSTSGATLQGLFNNPLVSPGLLGTVAGASFGAALALFFSLSLLQVQCFSFAFGLIAVGLVLLIAAGRGRLNLLLAGMLSGALFQTLLALLKIKADPYHQLPAIVHFTIGNMALADKVSLFSVGPGLLVAIALQCALGHWVNLLSLGDDEAQSLGVRVPLVRTALIALAALASSLCVVLAGAISWVGLVVPHLARGFTGADHRRVIAASAWIGASYLVAVDTTARMALATEIPTGLVTALLGIPFLGLLIRSREGKTS